MTALNNILDGRTCEQNCRLDVQPHCNNSLLLFPNVLHFFNFSLLLLEFQLLIKVMMKFEKFD